MEELKVNIRLRRDEAVWQAAVTISQSGRSFTAQSLQPIRRGGSVGRVDSFALIGVEPELCVFKSNEC